MLGRTIGNYLVERKLGEGGMGAVYLARHPRIGKEVAIKVLLPQLSRDPELVQRFFHEAKAATEIKNAHIVDVLDFGELPDGASYIVMEWLEGRSLADLIAAEGPLPLARAQKIARGIGRALAAAHARGIVHRDLKPDNIFLVRRDDDPDFVKVLDFGIAKLLDGSDSNGGNGAGGGLKTRAGAIMGTPLYMSPEQCQGFAVDTRADVYSLGVILYQLVTGRLPFEAAGLAELLMAHVSQPPPAPRSFVPTLPPTIEGALLQALAKDREQRFSRVEALVTAFSGDTPLSTPAPLGVPVAVAVAVSDAPAADPRARTSELFVRIGVRGKRGLFLVGGAIVVLLGIALVATHHAPLTDGHPGTDPVGTNLPSSSTARGYGGSWKLQKTDCPGGSMPRKVTVTSNGTSFNVRGGVPTSGDISADGHFTARNPYGTCHGQVDGNLSKETCTNAFGQSCHATYERTD